MKNATIALTFIICFAIIIGLLITVAKSTSKSGLGSDWENYVEMEKKIDAFNAAKIKSDSIDHANRMYVLSR